MEEKGSIIIIYSDNGTAIVRIALVNGNVWLTVYKLAELFNVSVSIINNHLRAVFKSGIITKEDNISYYESDKNSEVELYNLNIVLFLSYRIQSQEARAIREKILSCLINTEKVVSNIYMRVNELHKIGDGFLN